MRSSRKSLANVQTMLMGCFTSKKGSYSRALSFVCQGADFGSF